MAKGLELAKAYYEAYKNQIMDVLGDDFSRASIGLCGQGSECYGYDDDISTDHDFGPGFCIFLDDDLYEKYYQKLGEVYDGFPKEYLGYERIVSSHGDNRVGVLKTSDFYYSLLGIDSLPTSDEEWMALDESRLSICTNGEVFHQGNDFFMCMRMALLEYYPRNVFLKKLSEHFRVMSQAGQYNYVRCLARQEYVAAHNAMDLFVTHAMGSIYMLNHTYMPFYKWSHHGICDLEKLNSLSPIIEALCTASKGIATIEAGGEERTYDVPTLVMIVCKEIAKICLEEGYVSQDFDYMEDGSLLLLAQIQNWN